MQISALQAILLGVYYWNANSNFGYGPTWNRPLFAGMAAGLILGDMKTGIMIGAVIQPMFLAFTGGGGTVVWDPCAGTVAGVAITMAGGLPIQQALTVAVPISLLFAQVHTIRRIWFAYPAGLADKAAAKGNDRAIIFYGSWFCWLSKAVLYGLPMTLAMMFGAEAVGKLMANLPVWITNALTAVGGVLPALGTAMTIRVIGRPMFWPFFLGGFFLVQYTAIGGLYLAMVGMFFAFLYYLIMEASNKDALKADESASGGVALDENSNRLLTKADCYRMFRRWFWFCEQSNSFARLQSVAFCCAFIPALKKLYGNDPAEYSAALQRHLMFFNTQGIWGSVIHGIVLAMEEQRAMGQPIDISAITGIKTGLMGPFAGIGDTIDWATLFPLYTILVLPLAQAGNIMGPLLQLILLSATVLVEGHIFSYTGFKMGTRAALTILSGHRITVFISTAAVLGLFMMGGLAAGFVKVVTPIFIATGATPLKLQTDVLNKIAPGLLPLGVILFTYWYIQKGNSMMKAALLLTFLGLLLGAAGVIGNGGLIFKAYVAPKV
jgi:PTS system mannose-specific IID component